jgi:hypothetical protein
MKEILPLQIVSINRSMQDKDIESWANEPHSTETSKTNAEYTTFDMQEVKRIVERAKSATQTHHLQKQTGRSTTLNDWQ